MSNSDKLEFDLDDLPIDVFELSNSGLNIESLTTGHGLLENSASVGSCACSCTCSVVPSSS
jgi:hypothetical protein